MTALLYFVMLLVLFTAGTAALFAASALSRSERES